jgi:hypothetical protein
MIINDLMAEKYKLQKALDKETNHDISKYVEETHLRVKKLSQQYSLNFTYGVPENVKTT